jgi:hypothetical protein
LEVEEDSYDLAVTIEGENENSFPYSEEIEFEVEVDKEKHDIIFNKLDFLSSNAQCGSSASLKVKAVNVGVNDEAVKLAILNEELGVNIQESFELTEDPFDKDNSFSRTYKIILPLSIVPGIYSLKVDLVYGSNIESSTAELNIACSGNVLEENTDVKNIEVGTVSVTGAAIKGGKRLSNGSVMAIGIFAGEIIILILGIALLIHIFRK